MRRDGAEALVERLVAIQLAEGIADREMANRIGINRVTWLYLRKGTYRPSVRTLARIAAAFPRLRPEVQAVIGI